MKEQDYREFEAELILKTTGTDQEYLQEALYRLKRRHPGKIHAIKIPDLRFHLMQKGYNPPGIDQFRQEITEFPIVSCAKGVYFPTTQAEVEEFDKWLRSRAMALFKRIRRVREQHKDLMPDPPQLDFNFQEER